MRSFAVYNPLERQRKACAWVCYEPGSDTYSLEIADWATPSDLPLLLSLFVQKGQRILDDYWTRRWVQLRVPPLDRENISDVVSAWKMEGYYLPQLLAATRGRCSQDDFLVEEVPSANYKEFDLNRALEAPVQLGAKLGRARRAAGLTQMQLAEICGVQQAVISRIESGKANPTIETLEILAAGCGRTLNISFD